MEEHVNEGAEQGQSPSGPPPAAMPLSMPPVTAAADQHRSEPERTAPVDARVRTDARSHDGGVPDR